MKTLLVHSIATLLVTFAVIALGVVLQPAVAWWVIGSGLIAGFVAWSAGAMQEMSRHGSAQRAMAGFVVGAALRALVVVGVMIVTLQFNRDATIPATLAVVAIGIGAAVAEAAFALGQFGHSEQQHQAALKVDEGESVGE